jgi:hypothetical protein
LPQQFRTKIDLGLDLLEAAIRHKVPCSVRVCDRWYLAAALVSMARSRHKDWISLLKQHQHLETHSFIRKDTTGKLSGWQAPLWRWKTWYSSSRLRRIGP